MCTVSHCHKILPGFYRYKRCEQHRLQNRYHSNLKKARKRQLKREALAEGLNVTVGTVGEMEAEEFKALKEKKLKMLKKEKEKKEKKKRKAKAGDAGNGSGPSGGEMQGEVILDLGVTGDKATGGDAGSGLAVGEAGGSEKATREKKRTGRCAAAECCNLLPVGTWWRNCDVCREAKKEQRQSSRAQAAMERREREGLNSASGSGSGVAEQTTSEVGAGKAQADDTVEQDHVMDSGGYNADVGCGGQNDDDDRGVNTQDGQLGTSTANRAIPQVNAIASSSAPSTNSASSTSTADNVIKFMTPMTSTANLQTIDSPVSTAFRSYQPKTVSSALGRLIAQGKDVSNTDVFTDLLLKPGSQVRMLSK